MVTTSCATCHPPVPGDDRVHEGHVAVRFGDNDRGHWTITLDGVDVTNRCIEALAPGWVVLYDEPKVPCDESDRDHMRSSVQYGLVVVTVRGFSGRPAPGHPQLPGFSLSPDHSP